MKRSALLILLMAVGLGTQAVADDGPLQPRIGVAASFGSFKGDEVPSGLLGNKFIDDDSVGFKVYAQYPLTNWFAIEGAYHDTRNFKDKLKDGESGLPPGEVKINFDGWSVQGLLYIPTTIEDFQAYIKAGYFNLDDELYHEGTTLSTSSEKGLVGGAGAVLKIADNWAFRLDLDWFDVDVGDLYTVNAGVEYLFGSRAAAPVPVMTAPPPPPPTPVAAVEPAPVVPPPPPADSDGDGVPDSEDLCPDTPRGDRVDSRGCSCDVTRQVEFAFDSAELTAAGRATLDEVAGELARLQFMVGTVTGHTDSVGNAEYNQRLSERRAQTVADYLEGHGIAAERLNVRGMGEVEPIADNDSAEGRALNRRVVLRRADCDAAAD